MVNNKIERLPEEAEMAADWILPEGLPDSFAAMNMLLNSIPRDHDFDSVLMTTIDKNKDNNRQKGRMKLVKGFSFYMVLTGKNFAYEGKTEERYRTMLIVCNIQPSSGPIDMQGLMQHSGEYKYLLEMQDQIRRDGGVAMHAAQQLVRARAVLDDQGRRVAGAMPQGAKDAIALIEEEMDVDVSLMRKGVIRKDAMGKGRNKVCSILSCL